MKIDYPDGCEQEWREALSPWQLEHLTALHRQGKHLRDGTNHGSDERWKQAGCKTRNVMYHGSVKRRSRTDLHAHERVMIVRTDYGFESVGLRRSQVMVINPETAETSVVEGWRPVWRWYVDRASSANFPPDQRPKGFR